MKKNKIILTTILLCGLYLSGVAQKIPARFKAPQAKALAEHIKQSDEASISADLLQTGTLLADSVINNGKFKTIKYVGAQNGNHLVFIQRNTNNTSSYYAIVYDANYQPTDMKEYRYSCKTCLPTDTISRLWVPEDKTQKDFFIEYYRNNGRHIPMYTVSGIKTEYFRVNKAGKIIMIKSEKR